MDAPSNPMTADDPSPTESAPTDADSAADPAGDADTSADAAGTASASGDTAADADGDPDAEPDPDSDPDPDPDPEAFPVRSVKRSHDIVALLRDGGRQSLAELSAQLDLSKPSVHQHLRTLQRLGYVVKRDGRYGLGLQYLSLGDQARKRRPLYDVSRTELRKLAKTSGETAVLTFVENGTGVPVFHATGGGKELPCEVALGEPVPLPASAAGRAVLAELPAADRREILPDEEWDRIGADIQRINERALVVDHDDRAGVNRLARAVVEDDRPVAAVTVVGDNEELHGRLLSEDVVGMLVNTVRSVERKHGDVG